MKKIYLISLFFVLAISLLLPKHIQAQRIAVADYIQINKAIAIDYMKKYGIPASVILGIAIHESAYGNSKIARYLNNHFGIKGPNTSTVINSAYKGYASVADSYADFVDYICRRKAYKKLFNGSQPHDYRYWVQGIAQGGYATSNLWPSQVMAIIQKYELHQWDNENERKGGAVDETTVYKVQKGDTLYEIARRYDTTVEILRSKNGLKSSNLQIGQELVL